ncbi:MAG: hypothetical protein OQK73_03760 [Gammaproteobacteria bacterium]|nr:hypothetical protein [Gammaproteobacteria bacterium]
MSSYKTLRQAGKNYGKCAKSITANLGGNSPDAVESERLIAFGIASDWSRRAASLKPLSYEGKLLNKSNRSPGVTELVRFNLAWSGLNALFARSSILSLLPPASARSELERFRVLYNNANLDSAKVSSYEDTLRKILSVTITTRIAGVPDGTPVTTLHALHYKYTPIEAKTRGVGRKVTEALSTSNYAVLDLPILIYLMRNWSVHGALIDSSFRSVARFRTYIDTVFKSLAEIHNGISQELLSRV